MNALSVGTIADLFSQNRSPDPQNLHGALRPHRQTVTKRCLLLRHLQIANGLSNASTADPPLPSKQRYWTDPSFTFAGFRIPTYGQPFLATDGLLVWRSFHNKCLRRCFFRQIMACMRASFVKRNV